MGAEGDIIKEVQQQRLGLRRLGLWAWVGLGAADKR
jgi:hypothetical protein